MSEVQYTDLEKRKYPYAVENGKEIQYTCGQAYYYEDGCYYEASTGRKLSSLSDYASSDPKIKEQSYQDYWDKKFEDIDKRIQSSQTSRPVVKNEPKMTVHRRLSNGTYITQEQTVKEFWLYNFIMFIGNILIEILLLPLTIISASGKSTGYKKKSLSSYNRNDKDWY